jgi:hypothetical protein
MSQKVSAFLKGNALLKSMMVAFPKPANEAGAGATAKTTFERQKETLGSKHRI